MLNLNNIKIMAMKKLAYLLFISICLTGCQKCKKKQPEPDAGFNSPVNTDLYAYAYFKPGTYWVYQDSITNILDSVYVTYANNGTYTNGDAEVAQGYYRGTFNWFKCEMISSYDHYKYQNWMDQSYEVNNNIPRVFREKHMMPGSGSNFGKTIHLATIPVGNQLTVYPDYVYYKSFYPSFLANDNLFYNVQKWLNAHSIVDNEQNTNYYIAKNTGIIRREQLDSNRTWNLIRYNIIQ
jgi:hypothetical protein